MASKRPEGELVRSLPREVSQAGTAQDYVFKLAAVALTVSLTHISMYEMILSPDSLKRSPEAECCLTSMWTDYLLTS